MPLNGVLECTYLNSCRTSLPPSSSLDCLRLRFSHALTLCALQIFVLLLLLWLLADSEITLWMVDKDDFHNLPLPSWISTSTRLSCMAAEMHGWKQLPSVVMQQASVCESGTQPVSDEFTTLPLRQHSTLVTMLLCYHSGSNTEKMSHFTCYRLNG